MVGGEILSKGKTYWGLEQTHSNIVISRLRVDSFSKWSWPILGGFAHQAYASRLFLSERKCIRPIVTIPFSSCLTFWWSIESKIFLNESLICSRDLFSCIIFSPIHCHVHSSAAQYISGFQWSLHFDFVVIHPFFRNAKVLEEYFYKDPVSQIAVTPRRSLGSVSKRY